MTGAQLWGSQTMAKQFPWRLGVEIGLIALSLGMGGGWRLQALAQASSTTSPEPLADSEQADSPTPDPEQQLNLPPEPEPPPQPIPDSSDPAESQPAPLLRTEAIRSELRLLRQEVLNALLRIQALEALLDPTVPQQSSTQAEIIRADAPNPDPINPDPAPLAPADPTPTSIVLDVGTQTISLPGDVLFDFDQSELRPEATSLLQRVANRLREEPSGRVVVTGHTDNVGDENYNLVLSLDRANAVKDFLMEAISNPNQFNWSTSGYGAAQPIASNDTEVGRQRNRRVDIIIAP